MREEAPCGARCGQRRPGCRPRCGCAGAERGGRAAVSAALPLGRRELPQELLWCGGSSEGRWRLALSQVREAPSSREPGCAVGCEPLGRSCPIPALALGKGQRLRGASATCKSWSLSVPCSLPEPIGEQGWEARTALVWDGAFPEFRRLGEDQEPSLQKVLLALT